MTKKQTAMNKAREIGAEINIEFRGHRIGVITVVAPQGMHWPCGCHEYVIANLPEEPDVDPWDCVNEHLLETPEPCTPRCEFWD
jgi:hypothetical protein